MEEIDYDDLKEAGQPKGTIMIRCNEFYFTMPLNGASIKVAREVLDSIEKYMIKATQEVAVISKTMKEQERAKETIKEE